MREALEPPSSFAASTLQATHPNSHELAKFFLDIDDRLGLPELALQLLHLTLELRDRPARGLTSWILRPRLFGFSADSVPSSL